MALSFVGVAYLIWALVAGMSRALVQEMIKTTYKTAEALPAFTHAVKVFFVDTGFLIDILGVVWLVVSLFLVVFSSRQRISVSWAWVSAVCQSSVAAAGAVVVGWAAYAPHVVVLSLSGESQTPWETVSSISLPIIVPIALLSWVTFLVWLLVDRARLDRRGPTLTDGLRSNVTR
ncbi:MAG: hypothetical protein SVT52_06810 [Planctomycetota bacterium]|nr:hypothetical protein [Planctomycetota bacterium]